MIKEIRNPSVLRSFYRPMVLSNIEGPIVLSNIEGFRATVRQARPPLILRGE
jgi:hypothetical protein